MTRLCEHCFNEITGLWISDIPEPGQRPGDVPYWHLDRFECRIAAFEHMEQNRNRKE